jgi:hypothetical protein
VTLAEAVYEVIKSSRMRIENDENGSSHITEMIEIPFKEFIQLQRVYVEEGMEARFGA